MAIKAFSVSATLAGCNDYAKRPAISRAFPINSSTEPKLGLRAIERQANQPWEPSGEMTSAQQHGKARDRKPRRKRHRAAITRQRE